jgi:hypothetical protein
LEFGGLTFILLEIEADVVTYIDRTSEMNRFYLPVVARVVVTEVILLFLSRRRYYSEQLGYANRRFNSDNCYRMRMA